MNQYQEICSQSSLFTSRDWQPSK